MCIAEHLDASGGGREKVMDYFTFGVVFTGDRFDTCVCERNQTKVH